MSNLFISHSSRDNTAAKRLQARLEKQGHRSVFLDLDPEAGIQAGVSWERTLYTKLRACRAVVALCSDSYLASQWCFAEIALARMEGKELFVLQIDPWSEQTQMPSILAEDQYIDLRTNQDDGYQRLWNGFKVKGIVAAEHRQWGPDDPPYPGLRAFDETDAPIFFGREQEVREGLELLNRVQRQGHPRLVMVLGSSGSGKSSLARAGLVPRLRRDGRRWLVVGPFRPGPQPARELAAALSQAFDRAGESRPWQGIHRRLKSAARAATTPSAAGAGEPGGQADPARRRLLQALQSMAAELTDADVGVARSVRRLEEFLTSAPAPAQPSGEPMPESAGGSLVELAQELRLLRGTSGGSVLLVIDQFEELLGHDGEGADHPANCFLQQLRVALDAADSPILALATMRSDYLGMLQQSIPVQGLGFKSLSVGPMSPEGMKEIIERPALLGQIQLGDGLTDRLLRETGSSDALPLLAFTLRVMWDRYHDGRLLEMQHYETIGKLEGAVAQVADDTLETALELGEEDRLRDAFLSLARPAAEGSGWTRQPVRWDDLDESDQPMLQCFVDQRLLVKRGDGTVEVAHEALFRSWKTLRGWLDENAEGLHLLRDIRTEAAKWDAADSAEKKEYLWRGGRLARALELREGGVLALEELEEAFVEVSYRAERAEIDAEEARRKKELWWMRGIAAGVAGGLVIFIVLTIYANQQTRIAKAGRLAALAISQPPESLDQALLLSVEAQITEDLPETRDSLLRVLQRGLVSTLRCHEGEVTSVAFSPSGGVLASAGDDGLRLWRLEGERCSATVLLGDKGPVHSVAFSRDGSRLASGGADGMVRVWSVAERREAIGPMKGHKGAVKAVAFSPDCQKLASGGLDQTVRVWSVAKGGELVAAMEGSAGAVRSVAFANDDTFVSGAEDNMVRVWSVSEGRQLHELSGHLDFVFSVAIHGDTLASASADHTVILWSLKNRRPLGDPVSIYGDRVSSVDFSPDGKKLASSSFDGTVRLWDLEAEGQLDEPLAGHLGTVRSVSFSPDGQRLLTGGKDGTVRLWEVQRGGQLGQHLEGHTSVRSVAVAPAGKRLASGGREVRLWELEDGHWVGRPLADQEGEVSSLAFSPDGEILAAAGMNGAIGLWSATERKKLGELPGHAGQVYRIAFSPNGEILASAGRDKTVRLWSVADRRQLEELKRHQGEVYSVAFSPDARLMASGGEDETVLLWRKEQGRWLDTPLAGHEGKVYDVSFSPNGEVLASAGDNTVSLWSVANPRAVGEPRTLRGHENAVTSVAFARGGAEIVSGGQDRTVRFWQVDRGRSLGRPLYAHEAWVRSVAYSPEQESVLSGSINGKILLWQYSVDSWISRACRAANRNFSEEEWAQLIGGGKRRDSCPDRPAIDFHQ